MAGRPAVLKVDIVGDAKGVGRAVDDADRKFGRLGDSARKMGKAIGLGLAAAGAAAIGFGVAAVKSASAHEQSTGAIESIYGKAAGVVKRYAETAATNLGLAKSEYQDLAAVIGAQLTNMGRSQREAAGESQNLITMGADLAATFGGSVSDAVSAVSSLLKGERDPIERYGVSIKQSDINARLAAKGLEGLTGKALAQAQATATLELLTKQTASAHGAFGRESDTLAGKQERLRAQFENVKATVGARLIPVVADLFGWVSDKMIPGAQRLTEQLGDKFGPTINRVGGFITGTAIPAVRRLHEWFVEKIAPGLRDTVEPVVDGLRSAFGRITRTIDDNREGLTKIGNVMRTVAEFIADKVAPIIGFVLGEAFKQLGRNISLTIDTLATIANTIDRVIDKVRGLASTIRNNPIGDLVGKLPGFSGPPLAGMVAPGLGGIGSLAPDPRGLARSSWSTAALGGGAWSMTRAAGGTTVIDGRTIDARVFVEGDVLDAPGFLASLDRAQRDQVIRLGAVTAYGKG